MSKKKQENYCRFGSLLTYLLIYFEIYYIPMLHNFNENTSCGGYFNVK